MDKRFNQINMIPFIDIMLVLLAIVLTTASFVSQGMIEVNLPSAKSTGEIKSDAKPVEIAINASNELFFKGEKVQLANLEEKLASLATDQFIILRIDKGALFEYFIALLDQLKARNFKNLSIQTQQES